MRFFSETGVAREDQVVSQGHTKDRREKVHHKEVKEEVSLNLGIPPPSEVD